VIENCMVRRNPDKGWMDITLVLKKKINSDKNQGSFN
jgi:hypothetical protein